jgi:hypothetical protein
MSQVFSPIAGNEDYTKSDNATQIAEISSGKLNVGGDVIVGGHINGAMHIYTIVGYISQTELLTMQTGANGQPTTVAYFRTEPGITTPPETTTDKTLLFPPKAIPMQLVLTHNGIPLTIGSGTPGLSIGGVSWQGTNLSPEMIGFPGATVAKINAGTAIAMDTPFNAAFGGSTSTGGIGSGQGQSSDGYFACAYASSSSANNLGAGDLKLRITLALVPTPAQNTSEYVTPSLG